MISAGLSIRKPNFEKNVMIKVAGNVLLLICCYLLYLLLGTLSFFVLAGAYMFLLYIYIVDIRKMIREIRFEMDRMIETGEDIIDSKVWHQLRMYRTFTISIIIFLIGLGITSSVYMYYYYMPWIGVGAHIYMIYTCTLILSLYFRFQKESPYALSSTLTNRN